MEAGELCPLRCGLPLLDYREGKHVYVCRACGQFEMSGSFREHALPTITDSDLPYIRAHLRQASEAGQVFRFEFSTNHKEIAESHRSTPFRHKLVRLLEQLERTTEAPGKWTVIDATTAAPLLDARDKDEVLYLLDALAESGLIRSDRRADMSAAPDALGGRPSKMMHLLTPRGWDALQPISGVRPRSCFVAMASDPSLNGAYDEGIKKAISDCGLTAVRVDRIEHNGSINDQIIVGVRTAQFGIADVTLQGNGVAAVRAPLVLRLPGQPEALPQHDRDGEQAEARRRSKPRNGRGSWTAVTAFARSRTSRSRRSRRRISRTTPSSTSAASAAIERSSRC